MVAFLRPCRFRTGLGCDERRLVGQHLLHCSRTWFEGDIPELFSRPCGHVHDGEVEQILGGETEIRGCRRQNVVIDTSAQVVAPTPLRGGVQRERIYNELGNGRLASLSVVEPDDY